MSPWIDDEEGNRMLVAPTVPRATGWRSQRRDSGQVPAVEPQPAPGARRTPITRSRRLVPAGEILAVGLICFALWLFLDARQLYTNATASPVGTRRSVAMALLRPVVRVEDALGLDRIVDGANRILGRANGAAPPVAAPPPHTQIAPPQAGSGRVGPTPGTGTLGPPAPGGHAQLAPLPPPSPKHRLSILEVGDSLGVDLGYGLQDVLGSNHAVVLHTDAVIDTGLANTNYYNWPATLERELAETHPGLVIVFVGGNDAQSFDVGNTPAEFGTPYWRVQYGKRVDTMIREAVGAGAHVLWVGMPVMSPASGLTPAMAKLDAIYAAQAKRFRSAAYLSTWKLLAAPDGAFTTFLTDKAGNEVAVRDPDGIHLALPGGDDLVAQAIVTAVRKDFGVRL